MKRAASSSDVHGDCHSSARDDSGPVHKKRRIEDSPHPVKPSTFALKPAQRVFRARLAGDGLWGTTIALDLSDDQRGLSIGRKSPNVDLDLSEFTDVRTVSHHHAEIRFNRVLKRFTIQSSARNGTRLNSVLFGEGFSTSHPKVLNDGDHIEIGKILLVFNLL